MTKFEMIHTEQEGSEWSVAEKQNQIMERNTVDKIRRREKKRLMEERNIALRELLNRK